MTKKYPNYTEDTRHVDFKRLDFVVQSIKNVLKATIISALRSLLKNRVYTSRSGLVKGLKRKGGVGFIPRQLSLEEKFLMNLDINGQTIYDIGGNVGIFTMFFARSVGKKGKVITFEPNPWNCTYAT